MIFKNYRRSQTNRRCHHHGTAGRFKMSSRHSQTDTAAVYSGEFTAAKLCHRYRAEKVDTNTRPATSLLWSHVAYTLTQSMPRKKKRSCRTSKFYRFNSLTTSTWLLIHSSTPGDDYSSYDGCLEDKREDYQNCSVLYCVQQLYSVTHSYEQFLQVN